MERNYQCLRCGTKMNFAFTEDLQLGRTSWLLGGLPNLAAGAVRVAVYCCPSCGKLEFFTGEDDGHSQADIPQVTCPSCGHPHDFDYPRCPFCGHTC